jgi:hypothetical protein
MKTKETQVYKKLEVLEEEAKHRSYMYVFVICLVTLCSIVLANETKYKDIKDPCFRSITDYNVNIRRGVVHPDEVIQFCSKHGRNWRANLIGKEAKKIPTHLR